MHCGSVHGPSYGRHVFVLSFSSSAVSEYPRVWLFSGIRCKHLAVLCLQDSTANVEVDQCDEQPGPLSCKVIKPTNTKQTWRIVFSSVSCSMPGVAAAETGMQLPFGVARLRVMMSRTRAEIFTDAGSSVPSAASSLTFRPLVSCSTVSSRCCNRRSLIRRWISKSAPSLYFTFYLTGAFLCSPWNTCSRVRVLSSLQKTPSGNLWSLKAVRAGFSRAICPSCIRIFI